MRDYEPAPQAVVVNTAPSHMEREIELSVITYTNESHQSTTRIYLTRAEAYAAMNALADYLGE